MTVRLKSLRVVADYDAKGYSAGAAEKVAADLRMIRSGEQLGAALANADQKLVRSIPGMARLSRAYIEGYSAAEKFERALRQIDNAMDRGMAFDRAVAMVNGLERSFGRAANSADLFKNRLVGVGKAVDVAHLVNRIETATGVTREPTTTREEWMQHFAERAEEDSKAYEKLRRGANSLREIINPLAAAQDRLNAELAEYRAMADAGVITTEELGLAQQMANRNFLQIAENVRRAGNNVRLGRHEVANLSYQLNDVAIMLASGQSPFMLIMQQGGQIAQILGPYGLRGGIKALGQGILEFLVSPLNLALLGFAGFAAAATYAYSKMKPDLKTVKELLEAQQDLLGNLKEAYAEVGREVSKIAAGKTSVIEFQARVNIEQSRQRIQKDLDTLQQEIAPKFLPNARSGAITVNPQNFPFKSVIDGLSKALKDGNGDVSKFRVELTKIAESTSDEKVKKTANSILDLTNEVDKFQRQTDALSRSLDPLATKLFELFDNPKRLLGDQPDYSPIRSFIPDNRSDRAKLDDTYTAIQRIAQGTALAEEATVAYGKAVAALNLELDKTRQLGELDVKAIYAKSPAAKAAIAAERERVNAINTSMSAEELAIRVSAAQRLAYEQATYAITEQNRARMQAANDNLRTAQLEVQLVGASNAERALATANLQSYLDLQKQAISTGLAFDEAQYALLVKKNAEAAKFVELQSLQKAYDDLDREKRLNNMNPRAADIQRKMLASGVTEGTSAYEELMAEYKALDDQQRTFAAGSKKAFYEIQNSMTDFGATAKDFFSELNSQAEDMWTNFLKTGKLNTDNLIDFVAGALGKLSYQFAMSGIMNLFGGGGGSIFSSLFSGLFGGGGGLYANGGAFGYGVQRFASGGYFTNSVVNRPTMFAYGGKFGVMGEAGPEAVMPLSRTRNGKLGVVAANSNEQRPSQMNITVNINNATGNKELETIVQASTERAIRAAQQKQPEIDLQRRLRAT